MKLHKSFWLGPVGVEPNEVDGIHFEVAKGTGENDFLYEFSIVLIKFSDCYAMLAKVFSGSWKAYEECPEIWKLLADMDKLQKDRRWADAKPFDEFVEEIKKLGWVGGERHQKRYWKLCGECSQEIPIRQ